MWSRERILQPIHDWNPSPSTCSAARQPEVRQSPVLGKHVTIRLMWVHTYIQDGPSHDSTMSKDCCGNYVHWHSLASMGWSIPTGPIVTSRHFWVVSPLFFVYHEFYVFWPPIFIGYTSSFWLIQSCKNPGPQVFSHNGNTTSCRGLHRRTAAQSTRNARPLSAARFGKPKR